MLHLTDHSVKIKRRVVGATAWSKVEGREYDELEKDDTEKKHDAEIEMRSAALRLVLEKFGPDWIRMVEGREAREAGELVEG